MRRKATIIVTVAILLGAATAGELPVYGRLAAGVRSVQQNFVDLKQAGSMNSLERLVFSLVLVGHEAPKTAPESGLRLVGRS